MSGDGGKPENVVKVDAGQIAHGPQLLPGGRAILFTLARGGDWDAAQIVVQSLDTGTRRVVAGGRHGRAVCANRPSRVRAWEHAAGGAV